MNQYPITTEQAENLENTLMTHISLCHEQAMGDLADDDPIYEVWDGPSSPFCGCQTCETREYLVMTFTWLRKNGILDLYVD